MSPGKRAWTDNTKPPMEVPSRGNPNPGAQNLCVSTFDKSSVNQLTVYFQAPGTFGYDYSKYRPPRDGELVANGIELDDFGIRKPAVDTESTVEEKVKEGPPSTAATTIEDDRQISTTKQNDYNHRPSPPPSPAPFSHYTPQGPLGSKPLPSQAPRPVEEDDHSGGCCKCVIM